jgi:hypothetical protein
VVWPHSFRVPEGADIVINATSIGLYPDVDGRLDLDVNSLQNRKEQPNCALLKPAKLAGESLRRGLSRWDSLRRAAGRWSDDPP